MLDNRLANYSGGRLSRVAAALLALGALLATPTGAWAQSTINTVTTSTSSSTTFDESSQTERVDTFLTRITARLDGGATVFDQSFDVAFGNPAVVAAIAAAQAALNAAADPDPTIVGPLLLSASTIQVDSDTATIDTPTGFTETHTLEDTVGPGTIIIGNRDIGGTPFFVDFGTTNLNVNVHTAFFVDRLFLTTETYLTSEEYELVGFPQQVAGVPSRRPCCSLARDSWDWGSPAAAAPRIGSMLQLLWRECHESVISSRFRSLTRSAAWPSSAPRRYLPCWFWRPRRQIAALLLRY